MNFIILETKRPSPSGPIPAAKVSDLMHRLPQAMQAAIPNGGAVQQGSTSRAMPAYNRRQALRRAIRSPGQLALDDRHWSYCTVLDMSATGAMLRLRDMPSRGRNGSAFPPRFWLSIDGVMETSLVECTLQWETDECIGVRFVSPIQVTLRKARPVARPQRPAASRR